MCLSVSTLGNRSILGEATVPHCFKRHVRKLVFTGLGSESAVGVGAQIVGKRKSGDCIALELLRVDTTQVVVKEGFVGLEELGLLTAV